MPDDPAYSYLPPLSVPESYPSARHPSTRHLLRYFSFDHLPSELKPTSQRCHDLAHAMAQELPDGPELTAGLRKLLEAKDCFVRAALG